MIDFTQKLLDCTGPQYQSMLVAGHPPLDQADVR
jgi:hypothetical protein